jgi:hypothetical protein
LAWPASFYFLDALHGWVDIGFEGLLKPGKLLTTEDGGQTWKWVNSPGVSGPITFLSLQDGWLRSDAGADQLFMTRDGCKTWQEVSPAPPPHVGAGMRATFLSTPIFKDQARGFLPVRYSGPAEIQSNLVIYSTTDSGRTWQPIKVLPRAQSGSRFAIGDTAIIVSAGSTAKEARLAAVRLDGGSSDVSPSGRWIVELTFGDKNNGWVLHSERGLLATHDGGATWREIGPSRRPSVPMTPLPVLKGPLIKSTQSGFLSPSLEPFTAPSYGANTHLSRHLGFDKEICYFIRQHGNVAEIRPILRYIHLSSWFAESHKGVPNDE